MIDQKSTDGLLELVEKMSSLRVLVVGDIILDRYVWGKVGRISPEAPVPIVDVENSEDRLGGAANAVLNIRILGPRVSVCGIIGDDEEGQKILQLLEENDVDRDAVIIDRVAPTILKTRVMAHSQHYSQQLVRIDREDSKAYSTSLLDGLSAFIKQSAESYDAILVSDYGKGAVAPLALSNLADLRADKKLGLGICPYVIDPHPTHTELYRGITVATPNKTEAERSSGIEIKSIEDAFEAAKKNGTPSLWLSPSERMGW